MIDETFEPRGGAPGRLYGTYLAEVVAVKDDKRQGRVQIRLLGFDGVGAQDAPIWARVAVPFAGANRGAFLIPSKGDEVVVSFVNGDPRLPIVTGGMWNGAAAQPEQLGGAGDEIDRWTLVGKRGTRIAIIEEAAGATIKLSTPDSAQAVTLTTQSGGSIEVKTGASTITLDSQGITMQSTKIKLVATSIEMQAAQVKVDAPMTQCAGIVKADVALQTAACVATTYMTGAGNIL